MSILNKMFTVVLVVLCIAAAVATILIQRDVLEPKAELKVLRTQHQVLTTSMTALQSEKTSQESALKDQLKIEVDRVRDREQEIKRGQTQINQLADELADAKKKLAEMQIDLNNWLATATRNQNDAKAADTRAKDLEVKLENANRNYTQSNQKLAEATAQRDFLLQQVKLLREQIVVLQERLNTQPAAGLVSASGEPVRRVQAGPTIRGKVIKVADNMSMATIDVGANDGVQRDMQFDIFRDGKFLAEMVVTDVHAKMAVGRLQKVQNRIQEEDRVSNNLASN